MDNKSFGLLVVGISILIGIIILLFNAGLKNIVEQACVYPNCSMYDILALQTYLSLSIAGIIFLIGVFLIFSRPPERVVVKTITERNKKGKINLKGLDAVEKKAIKILQREGGAAFQSSLMEELEIGKVKTTRLMDKLEAKQLIERKRRGMNNIIVLKD